MYYAVGIMLRSINVEHHGHSLQDPMTDVLVRFQIGFEHKTFTHCVSSQLSNVNRGLNGTSKLQFIGFNRDYLNQWHLSHELLWILVIKAVIFNVPS